MTSAQIASINGSPSSTSRTRRLLDYLHGRLAAHGFEGAPIHVRELPADALLGGDGEEPRIAYAVRRVAVADAVIIATPVYKASYSGALKTFLDLLPRDVLAGKIVLPVATGGSIAHTLVLEYALRPVLAALGARNVLPGVFAAEAQLRWSEDAGLDIEASLLARLDESVERLATSLGQATPALATVFPAVPPTLRLLKTAAAAPSC